MQEALRHAVSDKVFMAKAAKKVGLEESLSLVGSSGWVFQHQLLANPGVNQGLCVVEGSNLVYGRRFCCEVCCCLASSRPRPIYVQHPSSTC